MTIGDPNIKPMNSRNAPAQAGVTAERVWYSNFVPARDHGGQNVWDLIYWEMRVLNLTQ